MTNRTSAPMSGDMLFEARAHMRVPAGTDIASLRAGLGRLANDLVVEVKLEERYALRRRRGVRLLSFLVAALSRFARQRPTRPTSASAAG